MRVRKALRPIKLWIFGLVSAANMSVVDWIGSIFEKGDEVYSYDVI